jgi:predicted MFS family arabinose efflux permease
MSDLLCAQNAAENSTKPGAALAPGEGALPLTALVALAFSGFITILTEALPAGLLPQISADLQISQAAAGQTVTIYALGSLLAAIPLTRATQGVRRRRLLSLTIVGFAIANLVTALSSSYGLTMLARGIAGISAGLLWALLAGYAARMVPDHQKGRAISIAMAGTPVALSIGVPAATFLGSLVGWRLCFGLMSLAAVLLALWINTRLPDFPGQKQGQKISMVSVAAIPGVAAILFVTLAFVLAHNILYTYIAPFLQRAGLADNVDVILLLFGCFSLVGIWCVGVWIDRKLRLLALVSCLLFLVAGVVLGLWPQQALALYLAVALWGIAFGGAATILQTAMARVAGQHTDMGQSMLVTAWNLAIAGGGILGGLMLSHWSVAAFVPSVLVLLAACLVTVVLGKSAFKNGL